MPHRHRPCAPRIFATTLVVLVGSGGCYYGRAERDFDRVPVVNTGVGATIINPGASAPALPAWGGPATGAASGPAPSSAGRHAPPAGATPVAPGPESSARPANPGAGHIRMIGGSQIEEDRHESSAEEPIWLKYALLPFALVAAPFKAAADALADDDEAAGSAPALPSRAPAPPPAPRAEQVTDYETARLGDMERELEARRSGPQGTHAEPSSGRRPTRTSPRSLSIADELAALQRRPRGEVQQTMPAPPAPDPSTASAPPKPPQATVGAAPRTTQAADGIVDRNGDGRIDQWIYREAGRIVRETRDDDGDGRPDRTLHYDPETHQLRRVDEDTNLDGNVDAWTEYRGARVVRRRSDANDDGVVDSWSFYRDGELARQEQDTTGDGFRDLVAIYHAGRLDREEQDRDGDGRPDVTTHYDASERLARREEDTDGDGRMDRISYYENGRLTRRQLLAPDGEGDAQARSRSGGH